MKKALIFAVIIFLTVLSILFFRSLGKGTLGTEIKVLPGLEEEVARSGRIRFLTADFAFGLGENGLSGSRQSFEEVEERFETLANKIKIFGPDLVVLFDVANSGAKTHDLSFARMLSSETELTHLATITTWSRTDAWFPFWPISAHAGRIESGIIVLSRYPLETIETDIFRDASQTGRLHDLYGPQSAISSLDVVLAPDERISLNILDLQHVMLPPVTAPENENYIATLNVRRSTDPIPSQTLHTENNLLSVESSPELEILRSATDDTFEEQLSTPVISSEFQIVRRIALDPNMLRSGPAMEVFVDENGETRYVYHDDEENLAPPGEEPTLQRIEDLLDPENEELETNE